MELMSEVKHNEIRFTVCNEVDSLGYSTEHEVMVLGTICAPVGDIDEKDDRAPIDVVAVIDKSGSMHGRKLDMVKQSMEFVLEHLKATDRLGIVVYDTEVSVLAPLQCMTPEKKLEMTELINQIRSGSCTNLSGALFKGVEVIGEREKQSANQVGSVLLFTDGLANFGLQKSPEIVNALEKQLAHVNVACSVFCFGFGSDHCPELLRDISGAAKGMYYFIEKNEDIPQAFADCLGGLLSVFAQNLELAIETAPGVTITHLHGSQSVRNARIESPMTRVNVGDIYCEEQRNVICMIKIPAQQTVTEQAQPMLNFKLSYFDVRNVESKTLCTEAKILRPEITPINQKPDIRLDIQRNRLLTTSAMDRAKQLADAGNFEQARTVLQQAINQIDLSASHNEPLCVGFLCDLNESLKEMNNKQDYFQKGKHRMNQASQMHSEERAVHSKEYYVTRKKAQLKSHAAQKCNTVQLLATLPAQKDKVILRYCYRSLPPEEWEDSPHSPEQGKIKHQWKLYVELEGNIQQHHIHRVDFHLHPSFSNPTLSISSAPFQIETKGWITLQVRVDIYFKLNPLKHFTYFQQLLASPAEYSSKYEITF